jgi:hypothetical protein
MWEFQFLISTTTFNINFTLRIKFLILYLSSEVTNVKVSFNNYLVETREGWRERLQISDFEWKFPWQLFDNFFWQFLWRWRTRVSRNSSPFEIKAKSKLDIWKFYLTTRANFKTLYIVSPPRPIIFHKSLSV